MSAGSGAGSPYFPRVASGLPAVLRHPFSDRVVRLVHAVVRAAVDRDGSQIQSKVSIVKMVSLSEEQQLRARAYPQSARAFGFLGRPCLDPWTRSAPFLRFFASDRLDARVTQRRRWAYSRDCNALSASRNCSSAASQAPRAASIPARRSDAIASPHGAFSHAIRAASRSAALNSARPRRVAGPKRVAAATAQEPWRLVLVSY